MDPINMNNSDRESIISLLFQKFFKKTDGEVTVPDKRGKKTVIGILLTLVFAFAAYYFMLPALNPKDIKLYIYLILVAISFPVFMSITTRAISKPEYQSYVKKQSKGIFIAIAVIVVVAIVGVICSAKFFRAKSYSKLMDVQTGTFATDVEETDFSSVPMLDEASAQKLGARQLGELSEYVSQYEDAQYYTQINFKDKPVRVTTLRYANIIKWITNMSKGIPAYMVVDMTTQEVKVIKLQNGIKYSPAEHFNRLLSRHLRFNYPTYLFDEPTFEIDDEGNPYWICARLDKTIGLFGGDDVTGLVIVDAITGDTEYHDINEVKTDKSLQWIDRVYSADLLVEQYNYFGKYSGGFWNSVLGQKDVKVTSSGNNYLALNDDVYMYTGVTSVTNDDSIIGFILCNQRTKETTFYKISGATEYSAMGSAEGKVQQYSYEATFPLLLNINGEPTFFMALKDTEGLVKMYSLVNVSQYQIVVTANTLDECLSAYNKERANVKEDPNNQSSQTQIKDTTVSGVIEDIRSAVMGGETYYYVKLQGSDIYYSIAASKAKSAVILNVGDKVIFTVSSATDTTGEIVDAKGLEKSK